MNLLRQATRRLAVAAPADAPAPAFVPLRPDRRLDLDLDAIERRGWIGARAPRTRLAEEFRHLKRPLLAAARDPASPLARPALILVTSAVAGEGKTFTAINLAMSIALEIDTRVLLADADVVRPGVAAALGFEGGPGLLDLLLDDGLGLADVVLPTNVPRLSILPPGRPNALSAELYASASMDALLRTLGESGGGGDVVVFDGPPLLPTHEARLLAGQVGQVVLVIEAGATPRSAVAQALDVLADCPCVRSVLNRSTEPSDVGTYRVDGA